MHELYFLFVVICTMKFLKQLFMPKSLSRRFPLIEDEWCGAGIMFTNSLTALVGYKVVNGEWLLSGFGGKKEGGEEYYETAIREVFEELYEVPVTCEMIKYVADRLKVTRVINNNRYVLIICDYDQLNKFMLAAIRFTLDSPIYPVLPYSSSSLVGTRNKAYLAEYIYVGFAAIDMLLADKPPIMVDPYLRSDAEYVANLRH